MKKVIAVLFAVLPLSACVSTMDPELQAHLEAERDFHADRRYREAIYNRRAFRPEVYANDEFLADCEYYQMEECYR